MVVEQKPEAMREVVRAASAGHLALEALGAGQEGRVLGATSRGLFLQSSSRWLIFLSYESYRSPFTITLQSTSDRLRAVEPGAPVQLRPAGILFPAVQLDVRVEAGAVWRPAPAVGSANYGMGQRERLRCAAEVALVSKRDQGLGPLLRPLLSLPGERLIEEQRRLLPIIRRLQQGLRATDVVTVVKAASGLLGLGRGLTASGDDFIHGMLLLLNRWPAGAPSGNFQQSFNEIMVEAAYQKTTTLSANLIECATLGESDERLLAVVDAIVIGEPLLNVCLPPLLEWGASSGVDALVGMATVTL